MSISISKIVNLPQATLQFLTRDQTENELGQSYNTNGGILRNTDYAWLSNGPHLQVINTKNGCKIGTWTFGWLLRDYDTEVVCIDEIQRPNGRLPFLAVALTSRGDGMICIFDIISSKVIRAILINDKINSLHVVDSGNDIFSLPGPLRNFDGILAVGTLGGDVFLLDICRQICEEALTISGLVEVVDEVCPSDIITITAKDLTKIEVYKENAVSNSHHLAIHLNVVFDKSTKHFVLKGPKGEDRIHVNKDEVAVSALHYSSQQGSLLVGYNFGAFQLWNLMDLSLIYTSPICSDHIPISHFIVQEPSDDPKAFCYIWAVYSAPELYQDDLPLAVMYAFCYNSKEYHEGYGILYQDFQHAAVRYQMELGQLNDKKYKIGVRGGSCLRLSTLSRGSIHRDELNHEHSDDNLALCVLVWNIWYNNKDIDTFCSIFDLNQWYKEQMPNVPNLEDCDSYMLQFCISDLINANTNTIETILDAHINENSLRQFIGAQRLEEHFYPNSLSFDLCCIREKDITFIHNEGIQKFLFNKIEADGPLCLIEPNEIYQQIVNLGLVALFVDIPLNNSISVNQQREIILNTALENQLLGWLCKCAFEWANGSFLAAGCSLDLLIIWAFQRATDLKRNCDNFCVPLFDYSERRLDSNTISLLNNCTRQIKNIASFYSFVIRKLKNFISNQALVEEQYTSLHLVSIYYEVLQWFLNVGLLPECALTSYPRSDEMDRINAPYPIELLTNFYNHRRAMLKILNENQFSSNESVLFIDKLIEVECGGQLLQEQWRNDGGNGLYPPPSLQALLRTYLIENIEVSYKHSVVIYVLLDLVKILDQNRYKPVITHLIKFPAVFKVSPSIIKITQAFWQLDNGDYDIAVEQLLDPLVLSEDLKNWHHKIALRALVLQKQHNSALLYLKIRKPTILDDEDIFTVMSLYVANNMMDEAFYFEKHFNNQPIGDELLLYLFNECSKNDTLKSLIYRSLPSLEENAFLKYLSDKKLTNNANDIQVYYHVLRSQFIEAFERHNITIPNTIESQGLLGQEEAIPRDKLMYSLKKLLPEVSRRLVDLCRKERNTVWKEVVRPTPMSVFVHNTNENIQYKSTSINAALAKAKETFNVSNRLENNWKSTEQMPFLRTPKARVGIKRPSMTVVSPKIIDVEEDGDNLYGPSPFKRLKLSPRQSTSFLSNISIASKLNTPIVKRTSQSKLSVSQEKFNVATPQSILKVRNLNKNKLEDQLIKEANEFEDSFDDFKKLSYKPVSSTEKKSGLRLSPRKSLIRLPSVRFEDSSITINNTIDLSQQQQSTPSKLSPEEKNYSFNEIKNLSGIEVESLETNEVVEDIKTNVTLSPRSRKSYRKSTVERTPVRSSPRLSRNFLKSIEINIDSPSAIRGESPLRRIPAEITTEAPSKISTESHSRIIAEFPSGITLESPSMINTTESPSRISTTESPSRITITDSPSRISTTESTSRIITKESPSRITTTESPSRINTTQSPSRINTTESPSKITTTESPSRINTSDNQVDLGATPNKVLPVLRGRKSLHRRVLESNAFSKVKELSHTQSSPYKKTATIIKETVEETKTQNKEIIKTSNEEIITEFIYEEETDNSKEINNKNSSVNEEFDSFTKKLSIDTSIDTDFESSGLMFSSPSNDRTLSDSMRKYVYEEIESNPINVEENIVKAKDEENVDLVDIKSFIVQQEKSLEQSHEAIGDENRVEENKVISKEPEVIDDDDDNNMEIVVESEVDENLKINVNIYEELTSSSEENDKKSIDIKDDYDDDNNKESDLEIAGIYENLSNYSNSNDEHLFDIALINDEISIGKELTISENNPEIMTNLIQENLEDIHNAQLLEVKHIHEISKSSSDDDAELSDHEKGFINNITNTTTSQENEVIEIGSSSEESFNHESSESQNSSSRSYNESDEEVDEEENIYERNIDEMDYTSSAYDETDDDEEEELDNEEIVDNLQLAEEEEEEEQQNDVVVVDDEDQSCSNEQQENYNLIEIEHSQVSNKEVAVNQEKEQSNEVESENVEMICEKDKNIICQDKENETIIKNKQVTFDVESVKELSKEELNVNEENQFSNQQKTVDIGADKTIVGKDLQSAVEVVEEELKESAKENEPIEELSTISSNKQLLSQTSSNLKSNIADSNNSSNDEKIPINKSMLDILDNLEVNDTVYVSQGDLLDLSFNSITKLPTIDSSNISELTEVSSKDNKSIDSSLLDDSSSIRTLRSRTVSTDSMNLSKRAKIQKKVRRASADDVKLINTKKQSSKKDDKLVLTRNLRSSRSSTIDSSASNHKIIDEENSMKTDDSLEKVNSSSNRNLRSKRLSSESIQSEESSSVSRTRSASVGRDKNPKKKNKKLGVLRNRSASVDDVKDVKEINLQIPKSKLRKRTTSTVSQLPSIIEEDSSNMDENQSTTTIEDYSSKRRMTRQQINLLQKKMNENVDEDDKSSDGKSIIRKTRTKSDVKGGLRRISSDSDAGVSNTGSPKKRGKRKLASVSPVSSIDGQQETVIKESKVVLEKISPKRFSELLEQPIVSLRKLKKEDIELLDSSSFESASSSKSLRKKAKSISDNSSVSDSLRRSTRSTRASSSDKVLEKPTTIDESNITAIIPSKRVTRKRSSNQ